MRVLGIDPGTQKLGYGIVQLSGTRARRVLSGVLEPPPGPLSERLAFLFEGLEAVVASGRPDVVAVEALFYARNVQSALTLGHARGVALLVAGRAKLAVHAYPPAVVKKAVVGHGRAEKHQVQRMIRALLALDAEPSPDEADALAIALCHGPRARFAESELRSAAPDRQREKAAPVAPIRMAKRTGTRVVAAAELSALLAHSARAPRGRKR